VVSDKIFMQEYLGKFPIDSEYERYIDCWTAYYEAADRIDGHIKYPTNKEEHNLVIKAGSAGMCALNYMKKEMHIHYGNIDRKKWTKAKLESLRRLGK